MYFGRTSEFLVTISDRIEAGSEVEASSRKSVFEA